MDYRRKGVVGLKIKALVIGVVLTLVGCDRCCTDTKPRAMKYVTITADRGFVEAPINSPLDVSAGDLVVFDFQAGPEYIGFCVRDVLSSGSPARIIPEGGRGKIVLGVPTDALAGQESGFVRISQSDANTDCSVIFGRPSGDEGRAKVGP